MENWVIVELEKSSSDWDKVIEEIVRIEKNIFPEHQFLARSISEELKKSNSGLLYCQVNGDVAGYVMFSWTSSLSALIAELAVKENYRRKGLGEKLLREGIQKCRTRDIQCIFLHVDPERMAALNLYRKVGFEVDTLIEGFYSPDRNAYKMYLEFNMD